MKYLFFTFAIEFNCFLLSHCTVEKYPASTYKKINLLPVKITTLCWRYVIFVLFSATVFGINIMNGEILTNTQNRETLKRKVVY